MSRQFCGKLFSKAVTFADYGRPQEVLRVTDRAIAPLSPTGVRVRILAAPINPSDINQIEGVYPARPTFEPNVGAVAGNEGLAEVVALGEQVAQRSPNSDGAGLQVGDWVLPFRRSFGTWQTLASVEASQVVKIPKFTNVSPLAAATLTVNPSTAYRMLKDFVTLRPGDYVIQTAANSSVGRAVIQLCKAWGIRTINIVRDRDNLDQLVHELTELGATLVLTDGQLREASVRAQLKELNGPVALGLDCCGGKVSTEVARVLSHGAPLVLYGAMSKKPLTFPVSLFIFKDIQVRGYWMTRWYGQQDHETRLTMWTELLKLIDQGALQSPSFHVIPWLVPPVANADDVNGSLQTKIQDALRDYSAGFTNKKFILAMDPKLLTEKLSG
ncbi:mitochondrial 2-enoyl thioester reductase [Dispira parvispora]|uniref:enoyl-[acyl-carrier-protein] reductase n=1 Tax=Dispira parvispora TaxID=1520584 RepID=A0A9W8E5U6_9FUNG|nr:mitochondrial 2-enoyl thioester reductase [Dispira parvispora]